MGQFEFNAPMISASCQFRPEIPLPAPALAGGFPEQFSIALISLSRSWLARTALLSLENKSEDSDIQVAWCLPRIIRA